MSLNTFQPEHYQTQIQQIAVINELLLVHIALAVLSYAFFAIAFVNSLLYIIPVSYTHLTLPTIALLCRSRWSPYH